MGCPFDERMGVSFVYAVGPRQHSLSRVPWDSQPYFTVIVLRLSFSIASYGSQGNVICIPHGYAAGVILII
jgi:hypothetical protein